MIRTNSFAVLTGKGAGRRAAAAVGRVRRFHDVVLMDSGEGFEEAEAAPRGEPERVAVALAVGRDGRSPPLVHGRVRGPEWLRDGLPYGEFAVLEERREGYLAARDAMGTRPLFTAGEDLASDWRFLGGGGLTLLEPGVVYSFDRRPTAIGRRRVETRVEDKTFRDGAERLAELLTEAVRDAVAGHGRVAVAYSGGLDSSVIALLAAKFTAVVLCSVHVRGSWDEVAADRAAGALGLELQSTVLADAEVEEGVRSVSLPFQPSPMDKTLWCIFSAAARRARQAGAEVLLLGQLADELFGGYRKYLEAYKKGGAVPASTLMRKDVLDCASRGFVRDEAACAEWVEPRFPFADERVAGFALGLPVEHMISGSASTEGKVILREAASGLGLPEELARSPKKAAQYSSGVLKQVAKLPLV